MTDKQIMIDGVKYNPCNGCKLWNGHHCIGARSYEPNANEHKAICNEHMAKQFYKVYQQLYRKTQECEELKSQIDADYEYYSQQLKILRNIIENKEKRNARLFVISNNYRKALEEIEDFRKKHCDFLCEGNKILDIIHKAKGEGND